MALALHFDTIALPTGVRLHYAERGPRDGEAVLLLHGYTDSWFSFSEVLPRLPVDWRAIAPDQRGHGDSDRPDAYALSDFAADALALLDALGLERATLVGHSMGTFIARQIALAAPARVRRLVLVGGGAHAGGAAFGELGETVRALADPVPLDVIREFQAGTAHTPLPEVFLEGIIAESAKLPARVWRDTLAGFVAGAPALAGGRIHCPTLVLWGDHDAVFGRHDQDELLGAIPGARLRVYPNTGHALHWEEPEGFVADLEAFVRAT